ncbi:unnamed protein product [Arctogadus glacialis]
MENTRGPTGDRGRHGSTGRQRKERHWEQRTPRSHWETEERHWSHWETEERHWSHWSHWETEERHGPTGRQRNATGPTGPTGRQRNATGPTGRQRNATGPTGRQRNTTGPTGRQGERHGPWEEGKRNATGPTGRQRNATVPLGDRGTPLVPGRQSESTLVRQHGDEHATGPLGGRERPTGPLGSREHHGPTGRQRNATGPTGRQRNATGPTGRQRNATGPTGRQRNATGPTGRQRNATGRQRNATGPTGRQRNATVPLGDRGGGAAGILRDAAGSLAELPPFCGPQRGEQPLPRLRSHLEEAHLRVVYAGDRWTVYLSQAYAQGTLGPAELRGSAFQGSVHVMPVKNEEGLVMMFILNFDYVLDEGSDDSTEKTAHTSPTRSDQRRRRFLRFRQAALSLMGTAKQPLPQEDPDAVLVDPPGGPPSPAGGPCGAAEPEASDTRALIAPSRRGSWASEGPGPPDPPWEEPPPSGAQAQPLPRDGPASMRRASSLHDMERFSCSAKGLFRERHGSEGPFNHLRSSLLGSNSESNINRYSTINKIPLIALNFSDGGDKKTHSPPASENTIIAPKVKDRTHNVTEKVTQTA